MMFFAFILGVCAGVLLMLAGAELLLRNTPPDDEEPCPPCNYHCNQGRDCPANK